MTIYGIKNCSTVKKALNWLEENNLQYQFHDYKKLGITAEKITEWQSQHSWDSLINKRGTTWRRLPKETQDNITNAEAAKEIMISHTSLIKRPILEVKNDTIIGFNEEEYRGKLINQSR